MTSNLLPRTIGRTALLAACLAGLTVGTGFAADLTVEQDRAAAAAGDAAAMVRLADRYETADGLPFDLGAARALLELAAERGHGAAQYRLGLLQAGGLDPEAGPADAYGWLRLAQQSAPEAPSGLLAAAIGDALAERLDPAAIEQAEQRVAAFEPATGPAELPVVGAQTGAGDDASLAALLPPLGCGEPEIRTSADGQVTVLAYAPSGSIADAAVTPGLRADLARRGAALDLARLSPAICAVRDVTAEHTSHEHTSGDDGAAVALVGVPADTRVLLHDGDPLVIDVAAASQPRYVAVDYVVHTGEVLHLYPNAGASGHLPAGQSLRLGDGSDGPAWSVGPPFGEDLVLVTLSTAPIGADRQPATEEVGSYVARLRQRLQTAGTDDSLRLFERVVMTRAR